MGNLFCHVEVVSSVGVIDVVLAAVFPLGAARETACSIVVLTGLATTSVLVVPVQTLQLPIMVLAAPLCGKINKYLGSFFM